MQVERVDQVVLEHVDDVEPDELVQLRRDRPVHVGEADGVGGVDLVRAVEVGVEPVHHHDHLVRVLAPVRGVHDEGAVEALGDVLGQRADVAVVQVQAGGQRVELVDRALAGLDLPRADPGHAVHLGRVDAVEVDRVRVRGAVVERDPQPLALAAAQRRAWDAPVVGPGGELHARHDLDLLVDRVQLPLAQHAAARQPARRAPVEVVQQLVRVEAVGDVIDRRRDCGSSRAHRRHGPRGRPARWLGAPRRRRRATARRRRASRRRSDHDELDRPHLRLWHI